MKKSMVFMALALFMVVFPTTALAAEEWETQQIPHDVESGVICTLDKCYKNLAACDSSAGDVLRGVIREKMFKEGLSKEQTYDYLAQTYGDDVLAAPPKRGFNWIAWVTPFVATVGGGAVVFLGLEKWVIPARKKDSTTGKDETNTPITPEYEEKLNNELKRYL
jgi:cytochrome c-type biogenesis protein CcmH